MRGVLCVCAGKVESFDVIVQFSKLWYRGEGILEIPFRVYMGISYKEYEASLEPIRKVAPVRYILGPRVSVEGRHV